MNDQTREEFQVRLGEYRALASELLARVNEAGEHFRHGDLQSTCDVVSLSHIPLGQATAAWERVMKAFCEHGITPSAGR